jgi:hypothetical protein
MEDEEIKVPYIKDSITPKEEKGLNMIVKGISKKYPFITGWQPIDNYKQWEGCIFLSIKVDPFKMGEYFKCPLPSWWDKSFKNTPQEYDGQKFYSLRSYLPDSCLDWDTAYKIRTKMEESLQLMYEHLPEQYSKYYTHTSESIKGMVFKEKPFVSEFILDLSDIKSVDNLS